MGLFLRFVIFIYISSSHADEFFIRVIYYLCSFMTSYQMSNKRRNSQLPIACSEALATGVIFSVFFLGERRQAPKRRGALDMHTWWGKANSAQQAHHIADYTLLNSLASCFATHHEFFAWLTYPLTLWPCVVLLIIWSWRTEWSPMRSVIIQASIKQTGLEDTHEVILPVILNLRILKI